MFASIGHRIGTLYSDGVAAQAAVVIDYLALAICLVFVVSTYGRFLFGNPIATQAMLRDPGFQRRVFWIFAIEVALHTLKIPILFKIALSFVVIFIAAGLFFWHVAS
jgi:uncharacterized protein YjeT (DUF2065 family)